MFDMAAFVYAWAPLERRWEAGGASALSRTRITLAIEPISTLLADFSQMQPAQPNPWLIVKMIFTKMIGATGAKEAELHGSSSVVRQNAAIETTKGDLVSKLEGAGVLST
jgi:hypothetical protein